MRSELIFQTPYWFIVFCLVAGAAYAFMLYQPAAAWGKKWNYALALLRGLTVGMICFLLLGPLVRKTETSVDKAKIVFAIDNSESVKGPGSAMMKQVANAVKDLESSGFEVSVQTLGKDSRSPVADSIRFDAKKTDLSEMLQTVKTNFEGRNLTDVILLSDGIVNQGISPAYNRFPFRVNTLAVGDTVPDLDIRIKDVISNRIAYLGNEFPVRAEIAANGLAGKSTTITLKQNGRVISSQQAMIDKPSFFKAVDFKASSSQKGVQHYTLELSGVAGETSPKNNRKDVYIDIIDGRQKILLMALAPHPDIKSIRSLIEANDNYELDIKILSISNTPVATAKPYDLIILHQIPNVLGMGNAQVRSFIESKTPLFFILGNQSAVQLANSLNRSLTINATNNQVDKVTARFNPAFQQLNFDPEQLKLLERLPPLSVPFGDYNISSGTETILFQKVGTLNTSKPLLVLNTNGGQKTAVLAGEGIWQWRQEEFAQTNKQEVVDNLFQKLIQVLSVREDKRKFRVYPVRSEFEAGEQVVFQTEIYNDIYEPIFGQEVKLDVTNEKGVTKQFTYTHSKENPRFNVSGLADGVYRFAASTSLRSGQEKVNGQFVISNADLELNNTTADFGMMRELASRSGGTFTTPAAFADFISKLKENRPADRLDSSEEMVEIIYMKWLFFLLVLLLGAEWGLRKYHGGY
ncbi:VWA domain-containing protein [Dyadobacter chenwenxiniae]|uniref:VWA domain-containing protein n=1 Tax=Dyadobacter chenwenxiniae TaxID=2906456 RepID=A0A9X1PQ02_9BACT|nr:VWA domain-containing protein [Dyadobacter chenwenxiniae]MCF0063573.1 VWA domain-containing protein [Dyadobacter chenwenxiniae]UON83250.1 VWA domain-containing protein [Dyadobacter chenwenxiniae]